MSPDPEVPERPQRRRYIAAYKLQILEEADRATEPGEVGAGTFVLVTTKRVLFARWARPQEEHEEIELGEVSRWVEATQYHRCAIALTHPPMTRVQHVTAHNFLWFHWGDAWAEVTRGETIFRFSQRDADVATALRAELERREVPNAEVHLDETPRSERHGEVPLKRHRWYHRTPRWARR